MRSSTGELVCVRCTYPGSSKNGPVAVKNDPVPEPIRIADYKENRNRSLNLLYQKLEQLSLEVLNCQSAQLPSLLENINVLCNILKTIQSISEQ